MRNPTTHVNDASLIDSGIHEEGHDRLAPCNGKVVTVSTTHDADDIYYTEQCDHIQQLVREGYITPYEAKLSCEQLILEHLGSDVNSLNSNIGPYETADTVYHMELYRLTGFYTFEQYARSCLSGTQLYYAWEELIGSDPWPYKEGD